MTLDSITRALLLTGALVGFVWYFVFIHPVFKAEILVIDKDVIEWPHETPPIYHATIMTDSGVTFGIDETPEGMTEKALYEFLEPGCLYAITYYDDSRVPHRAGHEGGTAKTIRKATKLSCPGVP